ncbi:RNI-like superfamily protein [Abeliophyllum distichum]|uniref:RNI-like superfamily protein n=1 Tax=Abeliophyllum distichum TaxID=126358 RepID=A0ABD1SUK2_9LAMI
MVFSFLNGKWHCLGCFEEERIALLPLKENINFPTEISLSSWVDYETKAGCCHWQGVQCSNTTGRVIQLDLDGTRQPILGDWYFNASLFLPFQELRNLSLGYNYLVGWIENEGFDKLSKLKILEALDLRGNSFDRNILSSLSQLSSLKHLNLNGIFYSSPKVFDTSGYERLSGLKKLQVLHFSSNLGTLVSDVLSILELNDFIALRDLDISYNRFRSFGTIYELYALNNLAELDLSYNEIENFNNSKDIKTVHSLQVLYLNGISVSNNSNMLQSLRAFPYLKNLYLQWHMEGQIAPIYGTIPQEVVMGCFSLFFFELSKNKIQGQIFPESMNVMPLRVLYLDNNEFSGTISNSLSSISTLSTLDISNNHLSGKIPTSVGNMTRLGLVSMSNNHLEGPIPVEICKLDSLLLLDLSENNLSGSFVSCFNQFDTRYVYLNNNRLEGQLTHAFYNYSSLVTLDLRENQFIGSIPQSIGNVSSLSIILLGRNHFEGTIPDQLCQMKRLSMIDLSYNGLYGHIPHCLGNITLEVRKEKSLTGFISYDITSLTFMSYMDEVISERAYHVSYIRGIGKDVVREIEREMESMELFGFEITVAFTTKRNLYSYKGSILQHMSGIDLSSNKLYGEIPNGLGKLSELHALNLSHNNLIGTIPETFSNLSQIESLDLSYNNLSGRIPSGLVELKNLEVFTVAHNNLTGIIPQKNQFGTFDKDSYEGNPHLCGRPLPIDCTGSKHVPPFVFDDESEESGFMDMQFFYISFTVSYVSVVICIATVLCTNPHWRRAWFHLIEVYIINPFFRLALRSKVHIYIRDHYFL